MSQITTHILDTARGRPAIGVPIELSQLKAREKEGEQEGVWHQLAKGVTNEDGRISDLLAPDTVLLAGVYKMYFNTQAYFESQQESGFFPYIEIIFNIDESKGQHYHLPLLLSPYAYSTYRGS